MKKKLLIFVFTFILLFFSTGLVEAGKKQFICKYSDGKIDAEFRLRLGSDGKTIAKTANISGDTVNKSGKSNQETVLNWSEALEGTSFVGKNYYAKNEKCPPYAYFFDAKHKGEIFTSNEYRFYVSNQDLGGSFEDALNKKYKFNGDVYVLKYVGASKVEEETDLPSSCMDFNKEAAKCAKKGTCKIESDNYSCEHNPYFACIWNETTANPDGGYCNTDKLQYVMCGDSFDIPKDAPKLISFAVNFLKIITPIILIVVSIITLLKALASSSEDQIKKAQKSLISKIIAAVMVFFVITIVQFVIMKVADSSETKSMSKCLSCFLNNDCEDNIYYKTNVGGEYFCTGINGDDVECR